MKLSPLLNFTNILRATYVLISFCQKKMANAKLSTENLQKTLSYKKAAHKLLVKLTPVVFVLIFFCLAITYTNFRYRKAAQNSSIQKSWSLMLVKLSPHHYFTSSICDDFVLPKKLQTAFCTGFLLPSNHKYKLYARKSCTKLLYAKKLLIKCWWNWNL